MFDLYENIKNLCDARGVTVSAMCLAVGISKSVLSNLKNGRSKSLTESTAAKIADYLQVDLDVVQHGKKEKPDAERAGLTEQQKALLSCLDGLTEQEVSFLLESAKALANRRKSQDGSKSK